MKTTREPLIDEIHDRHVCLNDGREITYSDLASIMRELHEGQNLPGDWLLEYVHPGLARASLLSASNVMQHLADRTV